MCKNTVTSNYFIELLLNPYRTFTTKFEIKWLLYWKSTLGNVLLLTVTVSDHHSDQSAETVFGRI